MAAISCLQKRLSEWIDAIGNGTNAHKADFKSDLASLLGDGNSARENYRSLIRSRYFRGVTRRRAGGTGDIYFFGGDSQSAVSVVIEELDAGAVVLFYDIETGTLTRCEPDPPTDPLTSSLRLEGVARIVNIYDFILSANRRSLVDFAAAELQRDKVAQTATYVHPITGKAVTTDQHQKYGEWYWQEWLSRNPTATDSRKTEVHDAVRSTDFCAQFITYLYLNKLGIELPSDGIVNWLEPWGARYVRQWHPTMIKRDDVYKLIDFRNGDVPLPGDIVVHTFSHCGVFYSYDEDSEEYLVIEGNTSPQYRSRRPDRNGGYVQIKSRPQFLIRDIFRVKGLD